MISLGQDATFYFDVIKFPSEDDRMNETNKKLFRIDDLRSSCHLIRVTFYCFYSFLDIAIVIGIMNAYDFT